MWSISYLFLPLYQVEELSFLSVLEDDKDIAARVDKLEVLDDVRVIESAQNFDFSLYFFEYTLHFYLALVQNFDGYLMLCDFIDRHYR